MPPHDATAASFFLPPPTCYLLPATCYHSAETIPHEKVFIELMGPFPHAQAFHCRGIRTLKVLVYLGVSFKQDEARSIKGASRKAIEFPVLHAWHECSYLAVFVLVKQTSSLAVHFKLRWSYSLLIFLVNILAGVSWMSRKWRLVPLLQCPSRSFSTKRV
jgi:hypothetical protein